MPHAARHSGDGHYAAEATSRPIDRERGVSTVGLSLMLVSPAEQHGQHVAQGDVFSLTADGPNRILELETVNGVAVEHDTLSMAADGRTLTMEALRTGDNTPQILVYSREDMPRAGK